MPLLAFDELYKCADEMHSQVPVAVAAAADRTVLEAVAIAARRGWIRPILVGRESDIREEAEACRVDVSRFAFVDTDEPALAAVAEVREHRAELLMKGQIDSPALLRALLHAQTGLRTGRTICQVVLMEIVNQQRAFLLADTGITIQPTLEQKADIIASAADVARALESDLPRVALLSASEKVSDTMPDTLEAAELTRRNMAGELSACEIQGPLSFDLAYAADAREKKQREKKRIGGSVCGAAEVMIFPNLLAANLTVKAIMYTAACRFGGVLCGAASPVVFMSRADTTETRLNSLALALATGNRASMQAAQNS
jgi:phosphate butyryltransferase